MRHKAATAHLGRSSDARRALLRSLTISLVEHGRIKTTVAKAKELKRHVERAVTLGKKGDLNSRRLLISRLNCKDTAKAIMDDLSPRFKSRPGGYTRIMKLGNRPGDMAEMALIEWVDYELPAATTEGTKEKAAAKKPAKKAKAAKPAKKAKVAKK
ncbi:MAG: 50S ribosomal protein L17 [Bdellovibrionota bacterium]